MNGRRAKALRRFAEAQTVGQKPTVTRYFYQQLKRGYYRYESIQQVVERVSARLARLSTAAKRTPHSIELNSY